MTKDNIKRLYRNEEDEIIAGVCSGIGDYLEIDPIWIRIIAIILIFFEGIGILIYLILWILMPKKEVLKNKNNLKKDLKNEFDKEVKKKSKKNSINEEKVIDTYVLKRNKESKKQKYNLNSHIIIGVCLVILGILFLLKNFFGYLIGKIFWPILIIVIGIMLLMRERRNG